MGCDWTDNRAEMKRELQLALYEADLMRSVAQNGHKFYVRLQLQTREQHYCEYKPGKWPDKHD